MKSVDNIQKITKAMQMVAAARLNRAKTRAVASTPFAGKIKEMRSLALSDETVFTGLDL